MIPYPKIDPVLFHLGPFELRWYGLAYVASVLIVFKALKKTFTKVFGLNSDAVLILMTAFILGIVIGGRVGHILFYDLPYYFSHPGQVFAVWQGGMSFHGGGLGALVGVGWFAKRYRVSILKLYDLMALTATLGLFFGRIANFINGELYGRVTTVAWGMIFPHAGHLPRHPSQLYEALLEGPVMFGLLYLLYRFGSLKPGQLLAVFLGLYGVFRFCLEFFREPDVQLGFILGPLTMGQVLCLGMVLAGAGLFGYLQWRRL